MLLKTYIGPDHPWWHPNDDEPIITVGNEETNEFITVYEERDGTSRWADYCRYDDKGKKRCGTVDLPAVIEYAELLYFLIFAFECQLTLGGERYE